MGGMKVATTAQPRFLNGARDDGVAPFAPLENTIERAMILTPGRLFEVPHVRPRLATPRGAGDQFRRRSHTTIRRVLAETNGDKRAAARILGVSVRTLQRKISSFLQASE
jgi:DNA-binding NtrC family response regulator